MDEQTHSQANAGQAPSPDAAAPTYKNDAEKDVQENKDIAAFSYLWVMSVVVFLLRRQSPFVLFHSRQAMLLFLLSVLVWFVPFVGRLLELLVLGGMVLGFLAAAQGQKKDVPFIGPLSRGEVGLRETWKEIMTIVSELVKAIANLRTSVQPTPPTKPKADAPADAQEPADFSEPMAAEPARTESKTEGSAPSASVPPTVS